MSELTIPAGFIAFPDSSNFRALGLATLDTSGRLTDRINVSQVDGSIDALIVSFDASKLTGTINIDRIGNGTLTGAKLANNAVNTTQLADNAVTNAKITNATIAGAKLVNATITATQIADNAVTAVKILNNAVTDVKINASAVTEAKIANGAITNAKIADNAINNAKIQNVDASKLTTGSIPIARIPANHLSISHINTLQTALNEKANASLTINGIPLSSSVELTTQNVRIPAVTGPAIKAEDYSPGAIVLWNNMFLVRKA
jgi:hypothetical protein